MYPPRQRIRIAVGLSVLVHLALLAWPMRHPVLGRLPGSRGRPGPLIVDLVASPPPSPPPLPQPAPPQAPAKTIMAARARTSRAPFTVPPPAPKPVPAPAPPAPPMDMLAMVNARRDRRRAAEAAREGAGSPYTLPEGSPDDTALAAINRNLDSIGRDDGTGGVFQILEKGTFTAEFAFHGWQADTRRQWREVIEVNAGPGVDIDHAIVRRMIELIRTHYTGDFNWESRRLGRVVVLSARPEDNEGLEEFMMREFFGTPLIKPASR